MNEIRIGDCVEVMRTMPDESIGMILTSPPYNGGLSYEGFDDNLPEDEFREFNRQWLAEAYRVLQNTSRMYAIVNDKMLFWFREVAEDVGWTFVQPLVWCKPNITRPGRVSKDWNQMAEWILLFRKGKRTAMLNKYTISNTFNWFIDAVPQSNFTGGRHHPAQLPFSLCQKIISRTPGEPVLDPFAGSGQVLRAAKSLKRTYLGIELVADVAERARRYVKNGSVEIEILQPELIA